MNANARLGVLVAVIVILGLLAGTWFVGISPRLAEAAAAETERASVANINTAHEATIKRLQALDRELPQLERELEDLRSAFPAESGYSAYLRELEAIGAETGTTIRIFVFEGPELYIPVEHATSNAELQAALASVTPETFHTLVVKLEIDGSNEGILSAIARLQETQRYALLHDIELPSGLVPGNASSTATLTGQLFILRDAPLTTAPAPVGQGADPSTGTETNGTDTSGSETTLN